MKIQSNKGQKGNVILAVAVILGIIAVSLYGGGLMAKSRSGDKLTEITVTDLTLDGCAVTSSEILTTDAEVQKELLSGALPRTVKAQIKEVEGETRRHISRLELGISVPEKEAEKPAAKKWYEW